MTGSARSDLAVLVVLDTTLTRDMRREMPSSMSVQLTRRWEIAQES